MKSLVRWTLAIGESEDIAAILEKLLERRPGSRQFNADYHDT
jgi:hypothetical protein